MGGPPASVLLTFYVVATGVGAAFVANRKPDSEATRESPVTRPAGDSSSDPLGALATAAVEAKARAASATAAEQWRIAAAAEYERLAALSAARAAEAKWYGDWQLALRNQVALRAQVARSAATQVQRNKAVSARADASDTDVARNGGKKGGVFGFLAGLVGKK